MKAKMKVSEIAKAVKLCVNAIDPKDPIRSNICFEATDESLILKASNGQYSIEINSPCDVKEIGEAVVDGKMAYNIIAKASGECLIESDEKTMTIMTSGRTKLPNINHELSMVQGVNGNKVVFNAVEFKNGINKINYAISEDQSRMILTGAHIVTDGNIATITALDGFRLAQTKITCVGDNIDIVVPSRILSAICDAVTDGDLKIVSDGARISVIGDYFCINAVTLSGRYIDTNAIIPTSFKINALIKTAKIRDCIESATVASGTSNLVILNIFGNNISITSKSENADFKGDINVNVNGNDSGAEFAIAFNLRYLINAIQHIDTEECILNANSSTMPAVITPRAENNSDLHLILPVRIYS